MNGRMRRGGEKVTYKLWAQGLSGRYLTVPTPIL